MERPAAIVRTRYRVRGRVQGVGYRAYAAGTAGALGLAGWVRNLTDGSVEAVAEGPERSLIAFERALRAGPVASEVRDVVARAEPAEGLTGFAITD